MGYLSIVLSLYRTPFLGLRLAGGVLGGLFCPPPSPQFSLADKLSIRGDCCSGLGSTSLPVGGRSDAVVVAA